MKQIDINGYKEEIIERSDFPIEKCKTILKNKAEMHFIFESIIVQNENDVINLDKTLNLKQLTDQSLKFKKMDNLLGTFI